MNFIANNLNVTKYLWGWSGKGRDYINGYCTKLPDARPPDSSPAFCALNFFTLFLEASIDIVEARLPVTITHLTEAGTAPITSMFPLFKLRQYIVLNFL